MNQSRIAYEFLIAENKNLVLRAAKLRFRFTGLIALFCAAVLLIIADIVIFLCVLKSQILFMGDSKNAVPLYNLAKSAGASDGETVATLIFALYA